MWVQHCTDLRARLGPFKRLTPRIDQEPEAGQRAIARPRKLGERWVRFDTCADCADVCTAAAWDCPRCWRRFHLTCRAKQSSCGCRQKTGLGNY